MAAITPLAHQAPLPKDRILLKEAPSDEAVPMDVLFVGGGPAGLCGAIELAKLVAADNEKGGDDAIGEVEIGVLEKAAELGQHSLSGAVVNPKPFRELFPDIAEKDLPFQKQVTGEAVYMLSQTGARRLPTPPTMKNHGNWVASLGEVCQWLGGKAEELGVNIFTGFPAASLLVEDQRVLGVRTVPVGLDRDGNPGSGHEPAADLTAKVTALSEGVRGMLTQTWLDWQNVGSPNPQIYALGVKELWQVKKPLDKVIHTLGWPLPRDAFGGSWMYPVADDLISLGLVVGLDYKQSTLDVHELTQRLKLHPFVKEYLQGGELLEWGAKCIPEGGYYSLAERRSGDGCVVLGDSAGFVDVPSLKGIHYAAQSGIYAARAIFAALKRGDTSASSLAEYDRLVNDSYITKDMHKTRNMRLAFKSGFWKGAFKAGLMTVSGGILFGNRIPVEEDAADSKAVTKPEPFVPDNELTFSKVDAVYKSGNATRDDIPPHILPKDAVPTEVAEMYAAMCPAGVYEVEDGQLRINAPNCVDCKATDVIGPRWTPREGGSGPQYKRM
ncbi:MAG: electron transfer flavoprotein-ubiquinone oxidoreductase [bacterium]|nr:electron transfer flavoprotein-ubiquinone oxidoreductase [bacterium]